MNNIILTGMPGAGKSTLGIVLAKTLGRAFIDTDILIQNQTSLLLQDIINNGGTDFFLRIEERILLSLNPSNTVIATGGSAVSSEKAMSYLKSIGIIIYLKLDLDAVISRISNISTRGIVIPEGQTLADVYVIRTPLYETYADIVIDCNNRSFEKIIEEIVLMVRQFER